MKHEVPFRVIVSEPPVGVTIKMQKGRFELLDPVRETAAGYTFEFCMTADLSGASPNFLGPFAQGPKDARFVYVNSGQYAGQPATHWARRAKLSLMSIVKEDVEAALSTPEARLEAAISGTGRDGGPVCASVKGIVWEVVDK